MTNPALDLDIVDKPFFEALDRGRASRPRSTSNFFTGDGTIGIRPAMAARRRRRWSCTPARSAIEFKQIGAVRDFQAGTAAANAQFEVAWEPRLRPMLLKLKADELKIVDDQGKEVKPQVDDGVERGRAPAREPRRRDEPEPRTPPSARPRSSRR